MSEQASDWPTAEERPELTGLRLDTEALERAWNSEAENLRRQIEERGPTRSCVTVMVQEYALRTIATTEAICYALRDGNAIAFLVLLRHLYEVVVTFNFLMDRDSGDLSHLAQVAVAHDEFSITARIDSRELRDADGKARAGAERAISGMRGKLSDEALQMAKDRAGKWSWTGLKIHHLLKKYGREADDGFYGAVSSFAHPHQRMISEYASSMTLARLEAGAAHARRRLREVRWMMQRALDLPFADEWLDSQRHPLRRVIRHLPHACFVDYRP
jgi:Family of unknown function (DUF5677)